MFIIITQGTDKVVNYGADCIAKFYLSIYLRKQAGAREYNLYFAAFINCSQRTDEQGMQNCPLFDNIRTS